MDTVKMNEYTIDDIYALPDDVRAELIDGQIYYMASPTRTHQRLVKNLAYQIEEYIRKSDGNCELNIAPFAVFLNEEKNTNYLEPDLFVVRDPSKLGEDGCHGAPDWVIEIVSPTSRPRDYMKKMLKYGTAGVREYWIVDPEKNVTTVYGFEQETMEEYPFGEDVPVGIYDGFSIRV